MKKFSAVLLAGSAVSSVDAKAQGNPVMRVVGLLKDLSAKLEKDAEAEETMYEKFKCWGTSTIDEKTKSNSAAVDRIKYLNNFIAEIDAGAARFTAKKGELEKEITNTVETLKTSAAARGDEEEAFDKLVKEATEGIDGMDTAMDALTKKMKGGSLLSLRGSGIASTALGRLQQGESLEKGLKLGAKYLPKADAVFLQDVMYAHVRGEGVPGAASPLKVESRLGGVIKKLEEINIKMKQDLAEDKKKDEEAEADYQKRKKAKEAEQKAIEDLKTKLEKEHAANMKAKAESEAEVEKLEEQVEGDGKLMDETKKQLEEKEKIFQERLTFRNAEQEAFGKAIEILMSDDARDLFAKSKPAAFIQESTVSNLAVQRVRLASKALTSGDITDHRILILASQLSQVVKNQGMENPTFDAVLGKIDDMKKAIKDEETSDLKKKNDCEQTLVDDTAAAQGHTNTLADLASAQDYLTAKLKEIADETASKQAAIAETEATLASAKKVRDEENAEFTQSKADDEAAIALLQQSAKVITDFYKDAGSFIQIKSQTSAKKEDGPPPVFETEYKGGGAQSTGVVQSMLMVEDDMKKDIAVAEKEEAEALKLYEDTKKSLDAKKKALEDDVDGLNVKKGERTEDLEEAKTDTTDTNALMANLKKKMADAKPECDFYINNYESRRKNRLVELNGLDKAKAILSGASFADEGDSLLMVDVKVHQHKI
eukprot:TRINITY_DN7564_c0_g1_i1.p1 TRINITY_DN7564_c0_g1~~TRINITY_DN7564_c0_g1_i1.p1  ORF type:complete len:712 (-),score=270.44 TRINITY_DN7564_c0_g1_i1:268-2403(-)